MNVINDYEDMSMIIETDDDDDVHILDMQQGLVVSSKIATGSARLHFMQKLKAKYGINDEDMDMFNLVFGGAVDGM